MELPVEKKPIMNPEIFLKQEEIAPLIMALNQFAMRVNVAGERKEILENAGIDAAFLSRLRFDTQSLSFAQALVAAFKTYSVSSQRLNYHPMVRLLEYLRQLAPIDQLEDQTVNLFTKLVLRGNTNFEALIARSAVGRIEFPKGTGIGTGVLIKNNLLLTCYHIFTKSRAEKAWIRFNYKPGSYLLDDYLFELDLDFLSFNNRFDYALLQVKSQPQQEVATLMNSTLDSGQKIYLIHHPQGQPVVISGPGEIMQVGENYIDHNIVTDNGSSGAPIFNQDWKLIAIHQGHPGIGRSITSGAMGGIPIYAIFNQISSHLA